MTAVELVCPVCGLAFLNVTLHISKTHGAGTVTLRPRVSKDEAPCCNARRDDLGRLPIGWCGPDCVRRPSSDLYGDNDE